MYHLKSIYLYQTATVNKLLKEGWEPFWGFRCQHKEHDTVRMYFRKLEGTLLPVPKVRTQAAQVKIEVDRRELDGVITDVAMLTGALAEGLANMRKIQEAQELLRHIQVTQSIKSESFVDDLPEHVELDADEDKPIYYKPILPGLVEDHLDSIARNEDEDYLENKVDEEEDLEFDNARKAGDTPAGNSYRVVDDIPDEVKAQLGSHVKSEAQEKTIDFIRSQSQTNITVHPIREDGIIIVTQGSTLFAIAPDGTTVEHETNANTQALG